MPELMETYAYFWEQEMKILLQNIKKSFLRKIINILNTGHATKNVR